MKWHNRFMQVAELSSEWSKDNSTKVGAVIVRDRRVLDIAYNGFPRGVTQQESREQRPEKYKFTEHAERNAINNCARDGVSTLGATMYTTLFPCVDCARGIIQSGIVELVYRDGVHERFDFTESIEMLKEVGIKLVKIEDE